VTALAYSWKTQYQRSDCKMRYLYATIAALSIILRESFMKVGILATSFPRNDRDFVGQWVLGLARALVAEGVQVTVIVPHDHDTRAHEITDGVVVHRFSYWFPKRAQGLCYGAGIPSNIRRHRWLALQFPILEAAFLYAALRYAPDIDLFDAHWTFSALPAVVASKILGKPLITHAYHAEYVPKMLRPVNRFVTHNSSAVISISRFTKSIVEKTVVPRQHKVIGFGVNPEKIAPQEFDREAFRLQKGIAPNENFIFAVGRLVQRKGFCFLLEAVALLTQQGLPIQLLLAGTGPEEKVLRSQIEELELGHRARLLGFLPDEELQLYLKAADVLVMPSVMDDTGDTEGLGLPTVEAMANGTPVVASGIGGITDIVHHEQTGLLVPPEDPEALAGAILRIFQDDGLRSQLIAGGYQLANTEYSWGQIAKRTLDVFETALRRHPQGLFEW
jgi:glycosyltransferase involved in cell wall biosynthesis